MLNKGVLFLLIVTLTLLASPGLAPPVAAQDILVVDDDGYPGCLTPTNVYTSIAQALANASNGDTIHVCEGDYTDFGMYIVSFNELTITGPGATPEPDGVATIQATDWVFSIQDSQQVVIEGLKLDVQTGLAPIDIRRSTGVWIQQNDIGGGITSAAVYAASTPSPTNVGVLNNNIHTSSAGIDCWANDCTVAGNTVSVTPGSFAIQVVGNDANITNNVVANGRVVAYGDNTFVSTNQITGPAHGPLVDVSGNSVRVVDNTLTNSEDGILASVDLNSGSFTIARNTFTRLLQPIYLLDSHPNDGAVLTATIGGSPAQANTFVDSGGALDDSNHLLEMDGVAIGVNAEYNNWGLCTAADIEQEIWHQVDDPTQGLIDFVPFIAPSGCAATPTPTPTPTPAPTSTPTPGGRVLTIPPGSWANFTWMGDSSPQEVADCFGADNISVMYRLEAASGSYQRWVGGDPQLSDMGQVAPYDSLLVLNSSSQQVSCTPDNMLVQERTVTIPAGRWANFAWTGYFTLPPQQVADCFAGGNISVMYRLDAATGLFQRWIRGRPELSDMDDIAPFDAILGLNSGSQEGSCYIPNIVT